MFQYLPQLLNQQLNSYDIRRNIISTLIQCQTESVIHYRLDDENHNAQSDDGGDADNGDAHGQHHDNNDDDDDDDDGNMAADVGNNDGYLYHYNTRKQNHCIIEQLLSITYYQIISNLSRAYVCAVYLHDSIYKSIELAQ